MHRTVVPAATAALPVAVAAGAQDLMPGGGLESCISTHQRIKFNLGKEELTFYKFRRTLTVNFISNRISQMANLLHAGIIFQPNNSSCELDKFDNYLLKTIRKDLANHNRIDWVS